MYSKMSGGNELVYPEGEVVELLVPGIALSVLEWDHPLNSSVINSMSRIQRVIEQCPDDNGNSWGWWEDRVQDVIELQA